MLIHHGSIQTTMEVKQPEVILCVETVWTLLNLYCHNGVQPVQEQNNVGRKAAIYFMRYSCNAVAWMCPALFVVDVLQEKILISKEMQQISMLRKVAY